MPLEDSAVSEASPDPSERHQLAIATMLNAGLRIGEVCALKWADVEDGCIDVHATMRSNREHAPTKAEAGRRKVPISGSLCQFRHQFATNLAASDVHPKVMQQLLGHTTPVLTLQAYTHARTGQGIEAIEAMEELKQRKSGPAKTA